MIADSSCPKRLDSATRVVLRTLVARRSGRSVLAIVRDWTVVCVVALICERLKSPFAYLAGVVLIARQMNALSELHHHAMHGNLFRARQWNVRLQFLYSLPLLTTIQADLEDHLEHHRHYIAQDSLAWGTGYGLDLRRRSEPTYMLYFLWIRPFLGPLQLSEILEITSPKRLFSSTGWPVAAFWTVAISAFFFTNHLPILFWYWIIPRVTLYPVLFFWEDMLGHYNCPMTGTRDFRGLWFRFLSPHGTAFHNLHHLYPAIPWFNMAFGTSLLVDEACVDIAHGFLDGMRQLSRFGGADSEGNGAPLASGVP
jgi:fatty acid desaturase